LTQEGGEQEEFFMKMNWLATTAIAFMFGTGAVAAQQPDHAQKREGQAMSRAQTEQKTQPDHHADVGQTKGRTTGNAGERAREPRSDEAASKAHHDKQAQQRQGRENEEPTRQSEQQQRRGEHAGTSSAREEHKGRGSTTGQARQENRTGQASEQSRTRDNQKSERAQETKRPRNNNAGQTTGEARQQEGKKGEHAQGENRSGGTTQQSRQKQDRNEQAGQGSQSSTQRSQREQGTQSGQQQQGENAGQARDRTSRHAEISNDQRQKIVKQLRSERSTRNENVNVHIDVGQRLPQRVDIHRLPPDVVSIVPQYRNYDYTVIDNRIAIVNPRSREVVDYIDEGPGYGSTASYGSERVVLSANVRDRFRELARSSSGTVGSTASSSGGSTCLSLRSVPEELVRDNPELSKYRYLTIGDEAVLVDPQQHKIVQVID
jgi:hypothetical protein